MTTPSKTEQILEAIKALLITVPGASVERNTVVRTWPPALLLLSGILPVSPISPVSHTPGQMRALGTGLGQKPEVKVMVNVNNRAPGTEATAKVRRDGNGNIGLDIMVEKIEGRLSRNIGRGEGLAPTLERRYGLNPAAGSY